jgi:hypothetical protein
MPKIFSGRPSFTIRTVSIGRRARSRAKIVTRWRAGLKGPTRVVAQRGHPA